MVSRASRQRLGALHGCETATLDEEGLLPARRTEGCVKEFRHRGRCRVAAFEEVDYEVESILEERCEARRTQFLVKWKGWPISDATWEDEASLSGAPEVVRKWRARCLKGIERILI